MANFYFESFPIIQYDLKKNGKKEFLTNIMVRFKIQETLKKIVSPYYDYSIIEGERPDHVAFKLYEDYKLDWIILLVNGIFDPHYDWPLSYNSFQTYIKQKYGSIPVAQNTVHEYRKILNIQSVRYDNTIIPKRTLVVDETTYNSLPIAERELITKYMYEVELNDMKRNIKVVSQRYISAIVQQTRDIFNG